MAEIINFEERAKSLEEERTNSKIIHEIDAELTKGELIGTHPVVSRNTSSGRVFYGNFPKKNIFVKLLEARQKMWRDLHVERIALTYKGGRAVRKKGYYSIYGRRTHVAM